MLLPSVDKYVSKRNYKDTLRQIAKVPFVIVTFVVVSAGKYVSKRNYQDTIC